MTRHVSVPPPLGQFLGGYFNQDWDLDGDTWQAIVKKYLAAEPSESVAATTAALTELLATEADDSQLERKVSREHGSFFDPRSVGLSTRDWLTAVLGMLAEHLTEGAA